MKNLEKSKLKKFI